MHLMNNVKISINKQPNQKKERLESTNTSNKKHLISKKKFFIILIIVIASIFSYFAYTRWQRLQELNQAVTGNNAETSVKVCNNILDAKCWNEAFKPRLDQYNNTTGVLVVGLDTREAGGVEQGVNNTDSIMVALFDHTTKKTTLISFPRDLYVPYYINDKGPYHARINAIYSTGEARNDVEDGFDLLQDTVERIIGKKIQYRVVVKLKGVEDLVNAIDGVDIEVPTYLKIQYPNDYPGKNGKPYSTWLYYEFQPGLQHMDGEHALVWSRFRKVIKGDMTYASDFSRAQRQQQVINAIKEKALNDEGSITQKAKKYWEILQTAGQNIEMENIGLEEILAGFYLAKDADLDPINIVLDPNFGGLNKFIYHPPTDQTGGAYYIKIKDESFEQIQSFLDVIWTNPKLYDEKAHILIENHTGKKYTTNDKAMQFKNMVYSNKIPITSANLTMLTKTKSSDTGVVIVDFTKGEKHNTTKYLMDFFDAKLLIEDPENYEYKQTSYKEDIKIVINPSATK